MHTPSTQASPSVSTADILTARSGYIVVAG